MAKKFDTMNYNLLDRGKVVYKGTTKNPERRELEHKKDGKRFTKLQVTSRRMTETGAMKKESESLKQYRNNHQGKNPKYNDNDSG